MYAPVTEADELQQGDIIRDLILPVGHDPATPQLFTREGEPIDDPEGDLGPQTVLTLAVIRSPALVVSQSCDVENQPFMAVARILPLRDLDDTFAGKTTDKARAQYIERYYQRPAAQPSRFYLQESAAAFPKSAASLLHLVSLENTVAIRDYLRRRRILRLNDEAVKDLQFRLGYYFGRYATSDKYMLTAAERAMLK